MSRTTGTSASEATTAAAPSVKRKAPADDEASEGLGKVARLEHQRPKTPKAASALSKQDGGMVTNGLSVNSASRPTMAAQTKPRPTVKTSTNATAGRLPASPALANPAPAPKKGSFADIMARAAAAQQASSTKPSLGQIKHKPAEKPSATDKKTRLDQLKNKRTSVKDVRLGSRPSSRSQSPEKAKAVASLAQKVKKVPVDSGYKGTMRPSAAAGSDYKGTMRGTSTPARPQSRDQARHSRYEEYLDDDPEESEDYDDLSDMEAGMDEMDEEEAASLALAKREDLEAKREEERHRREKERRRKLMQQR